MENPDQRKTTATSLKIVDAVAELNGARLTEISNHMAIHESTLYTHLKTLEEVGYITKVDSEYRLSAKLFHLGKRVREREEYMLARDEVVNIYENNEWETSFSINQDGRILVLFDRSHDTTPEGFQVGEYYYMHTSASGKVMLAEYSNDHVDQIIDRWGLPKEQENTTTNPERLFDELDQIRDSGYAVNNQESLEGLRSVAVAIKKPSGEVLGAIDIFGPPYLLPSNSEISEILKEAASRIEDKLNKTHLSK